MAKMPDKNKDCLQGVVALKSSMVNKAGEYFPAGQLMVITERIKKEGTVSLRPLRGNIVTDEDSVEYLGTKSELELGDKQ